MAEYIKQEMNDPQGKGEKKVYYRMRIYRNVGMDELVKQIARPGSGLSEGTVWHVLTTLAERMVSVMAEGQSVTLDGVGTFKPALGVTPDKEVDTLDGKEPKRNARSIEVKDVNFKVDKQLVRAIDQRCYLHRGGISRVRQSPYSEQERLALALQFIDTHRFLRVKDYVELTGLGQTKATQELRHFCSDPQSGLDYTGYGSHKVYVRRQPQ